MVWYGVSQRLKDFLGAAFSPEGEHSLSAQATSTLLPSSGSDDDFVKISPQDVLGDAGRGEDVALPTMGANFKVH